MGFWRDSMPSRMLLRSSVRASSIDDPERRHSIVAWGEAHDRSVSYPIPLEDFIAYGLWFQQQLAPDLERRQVRTVRRGAGEFVLTTSDGEEFAASRVVVAAGLEGFRQIPEEFRGLRAPVVGHTEQALVGQSFTGRSVVVVGGGQSALEGAALIHETGARVEVLVRDSSIFWLGARGPRSNVTSPRVPEPPPSPARQGFRARHGLYWHPAPTDVGGRFLSWVGAAPDLCRLLPAQARGWLAYECVKPAGASWLPDRLRGVALTMGRRVVSAQQHDGTALLALDDASRRQVDHVVLGTGYRMDVRGYPFLDPDLAAGLQVRHGHPVLRRGLESSIAGLHFLGAPAYWSFGPTMRFVVGTAYSGPAVTQAIEGRRTPFFRWAF